MKIAILSDSHDNIPNLRDAVDYCNKIGIIMLIHCGDLISPFMLLEVARFKGAVHLVYGNNVGDQHLISQSCGTKFPSITHHGTLGAVEAGGLRIAFTHYPELARGLLVKGSFDVVCCGHNHRYQVEDSDGSLLINPGELMGMDGMPTFSVLDCTSRSVERMEIGRPLFPEF
ncbi:MAG: YfcE family phosphodiesterase [Desulfobulbaceae bacterium]|nr:YfcE family phosphodiesterase [Desulfobulbaceae bacterium]